MVVVVEPEDLPVGITINLDLIFKPRNHVPPPFLYVTKEIETYDCSEYAKNAGVSLVFEDPFVVWARSNHGNVHKVPRRISD